MSTAGITPDTRYPWGQCTWWACLLYTSQAHHAGGTRARIGRAATGVVSSTAQFGSDRTDIADSMGHTAAEMAGRAGMYGMRCV